MSKIPTKKPPLKKLVAVKVTEDTDSRIEKLKPFFNVPEMHRRALLNAIESAEAMLNAKLKDKAG